MPREELLGAGSDAVERAEEVNLRPKRLSEFVGQAETRAHLTVLLEAARRRGSPADHVLFAGPPGLGKTSLAGIIAAEMGVNLRVTSGPALVRAGDLAAVLTDLQHGDVLFIDEIHRLPRAVEEVLYPAMEDFQLDVVLGKGPAARSLRLELPPFTLVGATTRTGLVSSPLRDRFGLVARLDHYPPADLQIIVERAARILGVPITPEGAGEIARSITRHAPHRQPLAQACPRRRGGPWRRHHRCTPVAREGLALYGVDELGLDKVDRAVLKALCVSFGGGPVGLSTLSVAVGEEPETVEDVHEPFLLLSGFLIRTGRGRVATPAAWRHLGLDPPSTTPPLGGAEPLGLFDPETTE